MARTCRSNLMGEGDRSLNGGRFQSAESPIQLDEGFAICGYELVEVGAFNDAKIVAGRVFLGLNRSDGTTFRRENELIWEPRTVKRTMKQQMSNVRFCGHVAACGNNFDLALLNQTYYIQS